MAGDKDKKEPVPKERDVPQEEEAEMAKSEEARGSSLPKLPPDEYTPLVKDFAQVVERGMDSYQEAEVPGREINYVALSMGSRTVLVCETDDRGIPQFTVTGEEEDNRGQIKRQRAFIGARSEASTKGRGEKSANLAPRDTTVKEFEVGRQAYGLVESAVERAQDEGEKIQRKIDEEDFLYFPPLARDGQETIVNLDTEPEIDLNKVRNLVSVAWQEVRRRLGSKAKGVKITFIKWTENVLIADTEGTEVSYVVPRVSFAISVKTKNGSEGFGALRGACGTVDEVFTRYDEYQGKTAVEAVKTLAAKVAKEAVDLDRAQGVRAAGDEFYVILGSMAAGVLAHEVYGHPSEGDIIAQNRWEKDTKVNLKARLGAQVSSNKRLKMIESGSAKVDLGDGRVITHGFGSLVVDNRGDPVKEVVLIDGGTQSAALTDRYSFGEITDGIPASVLKVMKELGLTGNARREKYDHACLVRMRGTYICPDPDGPKSAKEMAKEIPRNKKGIYVVSCSGGWVDPDSGEFGIQGKLGYLIENGIITDKPLKDITITGNITNFGDKIVAIGNGETITETFPGYCGKDGQTVPVDGAGPILLIKDVKAATTYRPRWAQLVASYNRQHEEVVEGKLRKDNIYLTEIADMLPEGRERSHKNVCVLTLHFGDPEEEINYTLGRREHADFESRDGDDGKVLVERRDPYA